MHLEVGSRKDGEQIIASGVGHNRVVASSQRVRTSSYPCTLTGHAILGAFPQPRLSLHMVLFSRMEHSIHEHRYEDRTN